MTRDEWVALPDGTRLLKATVSAYRSAVNDDGKYELRVYDHGGKHFAFDDCPLAEFEALLFAPAPSASDDYTRAGMAWAEAQARLIGAQIRLGRAAAALDGENGIDVDLEPFGEAVTEARIVNDEAEAAFLRLYRERHAPTEPEVAVRVEHTGDTL